MLLWALLVVLAACVIAWTVWPLEGVMIELYPLREMVTLVALATAF